ncbi:MAG: glycosyltransferase [Eubacteriales bacterium]|nr:glycosyltransferase [Eubacteriales bacterium]
MVPLNSPGKNDRENGNHSVVNRNSDGAMRVLWIASSCSLQDDKESPGLTGRYEQVVLQYCRDRVRLAVAYVADGRNDSVMTRGNITYYAVNADMGVGISETEWERARAELLKVIADFKPEIIQCFGAEWPYGRIAESVSVPVVFHMMGFLNIYFLSTGMARGRLEAPPGAWKRVKKMIRRLAGRDDPPVSRVYRSMEFERRAMKAGRYFMGRTVWDRNIVKYYSPGSHYFHVPELVKPKIYSAPERWRYHERSRLRLFTLSSADDRKGNEIILRTAGLLKDLLGLDFEWIVAGQREFFPFFEEKTGIDRRDVNIQLTGMIGVRQIIDELIAADFFIHPSVMDNSPHSICEAQLIGCPVIASNVGGVPQLVEDGVTGWLYPYNEPHTLAFMIGNLRKEAELLSRISANEIEMSHKRHDPERIARTLLQTYERILQYENEDK